jgi:hypothetical protein
MKNHIPTLKRILAKAHISPMLLTAVSDTIKALEADDLALAYQLTVVKSFITGRLNPNDKVHAFQEDFEYNSLVKGLGNSVYTILDIIHHDIAWKLGEMPSGMMIMSTGPKGATLKEMNPAGTHPIVKRIKLERNRGRREAAKRFNKRRS